ncbi:MAG: methylaspartate mutase subunit E, partial [Planctomycetota bacterium]
MPAKKKKRNDDEFFEIRKEVLEAWSTGKDVTDLDANIKYQRNEPGTKNFAKAMRLADESGKTLIQPRAGVALVDEHIRLLKKLEEEADLLPTTIDAYTRLNNYNDAENGIKKSRKAGHSLLNGFPAVNHGLERCRKVVKAVSKPIEVRHGTPDARLLAEITMAAGFTSFEGGGISYNIPYAKKIPLEKSLKDWQYVDRLIGIYEEAGSVINREPFGPLSGTLVPPFISNSVAVIEGLLALEQGARSLTLGYGQAGNLTQDVAALISLRELANEYFEKFGFKKFELSTVFHQWMGGFPEDEARAFSVISWGSAAAALAKATKVIVKTPHEAMGIPTAEANLQGLKSTRQIINMLEDQHFPKSSELHEEIDIIKAETRCVVDKVIELGEGDLIAGVVGAFSSGVLDIPFAPSVFNRGKMFPVRDNNGAVRVLEKAGLPLSNDIMDYHREKIEERAKFEKRQATFHMVVDD